MNIAKIALMPVDATGTVVQKRSASIAQMMTASQELRLMDDSSLPNTSGNPDIPTYLGLESAAGRTLLHIDQTYIITGNGTGEPAANISTGQVTVTASATQLAAARTGRRRITVTNNGSTAVYLGPSNVTAGTGVLLPGTVGSEKSFDFSGALFGITASGSVAVSVSEIY